MPAQSPLRQPEERRHPEAQKPEHRLHPDAAGCTPAAQASPADERPPDELTAKPLELIHRTLERKSLSEAPEHRELVGKEAVLSARKQRRRRYAAAVDQVVEADPGDTARRWPLGSWPERARRAA